MRRAVRSFGAVLAVLSLGLGGCSSIGAPELSADEREWCLEHQLPDAAGGPSVAAAARELGIASPDVERTLGALDATVDEGVRLIEEVVEAEASGDAEAAADARAAYQAWQAEEAFPAQEDVAAAMGAWSTTPEWAEACASAYERRGEARASTVPLLPTEPPTPEPTSTPEPTPAAKPTPRVTADTTIHYTSSTSVGRLIELTVKIRNFGPGAAGKVSVEVEGVGYDLASRTPVTGCIPDCRAATGAEDVAYVEWPGPADGKNREYTVQLKARRAGTHEIEVRAFRGPAGDPVKELASWTVEVAVR